MVLVTLFLLLKVIAWPVDAVGSPLNLTWVDASTDELGFLVERSVGLAGPFAVVATIGPGVAAYTDAAVADSTTYCYRVRSFNSEGYSGYSYPACGTTAPAALTLALSTSQQMFKRGDRLQLDVAFIQLGSAAAVDVYLGSVVPAGLGLDCPGGDPVVYVVDAPAGLDGLVTTCPSDDGSSSVRLYSNTPAGMLRALMGPNFFSFDWPQATPGDYTIFMTVTQAGTANVIAHGTVTVSYFP
ncbi:MAG: hypothetical protein ACREKS_20075 [Candidatus Rokuibacteriota bacterium]